jgi:AAA+ ATPase superfamily predicted ATPase
LRYYSQRNISQSVKKNPFKFGSIVDEPYFTNRIREITQVKSILSSSNHLIIISPRRFGKSSLISKVVAQLNRPVITLDLQLITSIEDFAAQLLKRVYRVYPFEKIRQFVKHFRIIPTISVNPVNNEVDIAFRPASSQMPLLEDVLNLVEKLSSEKKKAIVVFDEFQEVQHIDVNLTRQLRSVMQYHKNINYVFLGSQESLIRNIFEKKNSSFYHFGMLLQLDKIPRIDFESYLLNGLKDMGDKNAEITEAILDFTDCHPYYTQQLAFAVWEIRNQQEPVADYLEEAISALVRVHDMDYEQIWNSFNKTDKKLLIGLSLSDLTPLSEAFYRKYDIGSPSTVYSSLKRLMLSGYITKSANKYGIDDPFFSRWIKQRRAQ